MPLYGRVFHGVAKPEIGIPFTKERAPGCVENDIIDYKNIDDGFDVELFDSRKVGAIKFDSKESNLSLMIIINLLLSKEVMFV